MSGVSPYELLTFASSSVAAALGALLLGLRIPDGQALGTLRTARDYLALSCFIWAAAGFAGTFLHPDVGDKPRPSARPKLITTRNRRLEVVRSEFARIRGTQNLRRGFLWQDRQTVENPHGIKRKNGRISCKHDIRPFFISSPSALFQPFIYFLLKKFIVRSNPIVVNERIASPNTLSRSGSALRSSSDHSPST